MTGRLKQPIWIVPLIIAGLVALFGWWGNDRLRQNIEDQLKAELTTTLNANVTALEIWTTNQTRLATSLAEQPQVRTLASRILEHTPQAAGQNGRSSNLVDAEQLANYLRPRLRQMGYEIAQLVSTNFVVVASSPRGRLGAGLPVAEAQTNKFSELFASGQPIIITPFKPELTVPRRYAPPGRTNDFADELSVSNRAALRPRRISDFQRRRGDFTLMQVAAPLRDDNGVVCGALALVINPDDEFTRILSVARSGQSGETYAFDQTGLLISRSRFDSQLRKLGLLDQTNSSSALNLRLHDPGGDLTRGFKPETNSAAKPLIRLVADAVNGENGADMRPSNDYRGVPVVGAWRWLPQLGFGVATQIDADEAYRPLRVLQLIFVLLFLLLVLSAVGLFLFSYSNLTWRRRLTEAQLKLKQLGQYTLEEKIGEGGMGVVYRARHALMRRDTAVKLLLPDLADAASIERFEREVCLTCQLTHPNTIQVYDYGHTPEGIFYYAMEYLRGLNLHQLVSRFGPQPEGRVIHILTQVCESLAEAHALGLVHRDIKPANVFLCDRGGIPDCVKVLDFGLVREYNRQNQDKLTLTGEGGFVGTPSFMSPEAIKNSSRNDPRSDIYSVGALGYYLLTGKYVFEADSVLAIYEKQLTTLPVQPSQRTTNLISAEMEKIILNCLDKEPELRPQSAGELHALLLACPLASRWPPEARSAWWRQFQEQVQLAVKADSANASPIPTVKIDFASRM
jgi:serine/threonine protein kinase